MKRWKQVPDRLKKYRYPALILALGLLLLLLPSGDRGEESLPARSEAGEFDLAAFTSEVEAVLSGVDGVGELKLILSLESDGERSYLANFTEDPGGTGRTEYVLRDSGGADVPVPFTYSFPEFRGAVVVCRGADSPAVALALKEALSGLVGLGMDKITILKMG